MTKVWWCKSSVVSVPCTEMAVRRVYTYSHKSKEIFDHRTFCTQVRLKTYHVRMKAALIQHPTEFGIKNGILFLDLRSFSAGKVPAPGTSVALLAALYRDLCLGRRYAENTPFLHHRFTVCKMCIQQEADCGIDEILYFRWVMRWRRRKARSTGEKWRYWLRRECVSRCGFTCSIKDCVRLVTGMMLELRYQMNSDAISCVA